MARRFWPNEDAIGKRLAVRRIQKDSDWLSVIGVVKDVRQFELAAEPRPQMYLSYRQFGFFGSDDLVVKTDVDPASMAATVRKAVCNESRSDHRSTI